MDFTPTEEQTAARDLAADILTDLSTHERLSALGDGTDAELWKALCAAGIPGATEDIGLLGLALVLEEQGRTTAQVPLAATCAYGLLPVGMYGSEGTRERLLPALRDGTAVATGAFPLPGRRSAVTAVERDGGWRLSGTVPMVPWLREATHVLVPARCAADGTEGGEGADGTVRCFLVEPVESLGAGVTAVATTAPWSAGRLVLESAPGEPLADGAYEPTLARARTAFAALQAGVCAGSLTRAVAYTCEREQFGRPLSTNQGVQLRAADAHMDTEAIRVTTYEAAWRHDRGLPARTHSLTAAWWAAEAGRRVVHAGQHLHGGIGADLDHPVHRHFLWGRQLDAYLGAPGQLLAELGGLLADPGTDAERLDPGTEAERLPGTEAERLEEK
ncbi:acyl-CoA dehydrogenase family protein [Streptomyces iconiensis]|uniref:Acyl-CoA dehydrogenase family protein n=1 Tax=Streptomyces iconiensis TaxID=1384038 RepID=A0ABT7A5S5_9ACTN|nr:acyl-CoA dehydrogenase family protein [Streptomyces iconiensis]MDJ1136196.1 acyl-CoA dehydrogenase family protein [Streptomyces iconiensis]